MTNSNVTNLAAEDLAPTSAMRAMDGHTAPPDTADQTRRRRRRETEIADFDEPIPSSDDPAHQLDDLA